MSVVTLTPSLLSEACSQLSRRVIASGCNPVALVGILSGGAEVARLMCQDFPNAAYCEVRLSRPGTKEKNAGFLHHLLQSMPLFVCDWLRMAESRINEWRSKDKQPVRIGEINLTKEVIERLSEAKDEMWQSEPKEPVILLIDDAIDTGATMKLAKEQLESQYPGVSIVTAVITVTTEHPLFDADVYLFHNRTLCRFPWSNDYRK